MNTNLNTTATMINANQQVLDILGIKDFINFLQTTADNFKVDIEKLFPLGYELSNIHNVYRIEEYFVEVVMDNLFKTLEERDYSTEYIAYTLLSVDTAKVFFMGKEIKSLAELDAEEESLSQYAKKQHFLKGEMKEEFERYVSTNSAKDRDNFIAFKFKDLDDATCSICNDGEIGGNPIYYLNINAFSDLARSNSAYCLFMDTFFKGKQCIVIDTDTTHITEDMFNQLEKTYDYHGWLKIVNPKCEYSKDSLYDEVYELYPTITPDTVCKYRYDFLKENIDTMYEAYENDKFSPSEHDAKVSYIKQTFEKWSLAKGITKQVLVISNVENEKKSNKEKRVYVFSINSTQGELDGDINDLSDEEFMNFAERDGRIYSSVEGFINAFNNSEIDTECDYARIIEVDCFD